MNLIHNGLTFLEAVKLAADTIPGIAHDMQWCQERRKRKKSKDMEGIGRMGLHIPDPIMALLKLYHPELFEGEQKDYSSQWLKFMQHPDSQPFRVLNKL